MWKILNSAAGYRIISHSIPSKILVRTLLSDAYKCTSSWNKRLSTPVLQKVKLDNLYYDLEDNFGIDGKATAIDVDIYANSVNDVDHLDSLADLLHKLRLSRETTNTLDSTPHAVIRIFHELGEHEELLKILNDRINYGIFLDQYTANILLDSFIESKDYTSAAKIASMLMLQEDFSNAINKALSLQACLKYIKEPQPFEPPTEEPVIETKPQGKKKKDEIRIRVKYLRNPFFDDHFDLRDGDLLVGKTLNMIGQLLDNKTLGNSCSLIGLVMHRKYDKAVKLLEAINKGEVYEEAIAFVKNLLNTTQTSSESEQGLIENVKLLVNSLKGELGLYTECDNMIRDAIKTQEPLDIAEQIKLHEEWNNVREFKLQEQLERYQRASRVAEIEKELKELEEEERRLWFFENEEQLDLQIENKKVFYPKKWFGKKKKPRTIDEDYVPPEVQKQF